MITHIEHEIDARAEVGSANIRLLCLHLRLTGNAPVYRSINEAR